MPAPFDLEFFQRGVIEVLLLAIAAGLVGTWVVLRGLAFFAHAVGTATFPGLVLADGLGFAAVLGAFGSALVLAAVVALASNRRDDSRDRVTAIALAAALATGVILASDVFGSQARVDRLLFGSLLAIDGSDQLLAAIAAGLAAIATWSLGPRWLAAGFSGGERGVGPRGTDGALALLVAFTAVASLSAVGALLATTLIVVPAATTRLLTARLATWQIATVALAAAEGVGGLWLSFELNAPPGPGIAVLGGAVFACAAIGRVLWSRTRVRPAAHPGLPLVVPALAMLAAFAVAGCGSESGAGDGRVSVVTTTTQLADIAREVAGPAADVRGVLRPGSDPHTYEPRPADLEAVGRADVVLTSGLGLDDWAREVVDAAGGDARVIDVGAQVPVRRRTTGGDADPHWWHDPRNAIAASRIIERALTRAGAPAAALSRSARAYRARLATLDARIRRCFERVPPSERKLVTDHDALSYFAARYGLQVVGAVFPAQSTQAQASAGDVASLERLIRAEHVRAVFPDAALNARLSERIARDTGASAADRLYGDSLGPPSSRAGTLAGMLAANAAAIVRGISGGRERCDVAS